MSIDVYEVLRDLTGLPAVTGFEEQRRSRIVEYYGRYCDSVTVDVIGNVIGTIGSGDRSVMLAGHYDQLGFMINHVDKDGYASFAKVGGWDKRLVYGTRVRIWIGDGPEDYLVGTVATKAPHLTEEKERDKTPEIKDMRIDFGAKDAEEAEGMGVKPGCVATPYHLIDRLGDKNSDYVIAPAFDDVCSIASFMRVLGDISESPPDGLTLNVVATVQEEIGFRGATVSAFNLKPWCAIACDVTHAVSPGITESEVGGVTLGGGPVIGVGANFTRRLWEIIEREANRLGIPHQREGVPSRSGTDAWAMQVTRGGTISGLISIPNRYMHSPNEVVSLQDLENTGKLLSATIRALNKTDIKHERVVHQKRQP